jgi:hypothetical protein
MIHQKQPKYGGGATATIQKVLSKPSADSLEGKNQLTNDFLILDLIKMRVMQQLLFPFLSQFESFQPVDS